MVTGDFVILSGVVFQVKLREGSRPPEAGPPPAEDPSPPSGAQDDASQNEV